MIDAPLLTLWLSLASLASVADMRVVVVGADAAAVADVEAAAVAAGAVVDVDACVGKDGAVVEGVAGDRERARRALADARARFRELDFDAAQREIDAARAELLRLDRPDDHRELVVDVLVTAATIAFAKDPNDTRPLRDLRLASRLEPSRAELDPGLHRPTVVAAWTAAREQNAAAPSAFIAVAPRVVGARVVAEVVVDGVVRVPDGGRLRLAHGPHLITLRGPGLVGRSVVVDVAADTTPLAVVLAPADAPARRAAAAVRAATDDAALRDLSALCDAQVVIVLPHNDAEGAARGGRVRGSDGVVHALPALGADVSGAAVVDAVAVALAPPLPPPPPPVVVDPGEGTLWWSVAGVSASVAAVAVATGVYVLLPGEPPPPPPRPLPVGCCVQ